MKPLVKIILVEDHPVFREGLRRMIQETDIGEVIGEAENGAIFLEMMKTLKPDIVMMDINMPVMNGIEATEKALALYPHLKVIVLSMFGEEEYVYSMVNKGVAGFVLKSSKPADIMNAIKAVNSGQQYYSVEILSLLVKKIRQAQAPTHIQFTEKEKQVLSLICKGYSTTEIGEKLFLGERTIEGYRGKLLEKTGQPNTVNLVIFALKNKLITLEELEPSNRKN